MPLRTWRVRNVPALPDAAVVLRGGLLDIEVMRKSITQCHQIYGVWALSVAAKADCSPLDIWKRSRGLRGYGRVRMATAGAIRGLSGPPRLVPMGDDPHYSIVWEGEPTDDQLRELAAAFVQEFDPEAGA